MRWFWSLVLDPFHKHTWKLVDDSGIYKAGIVLRRTCKFECKCGEARTFHRWGLLKGAGSLHYFFGSRI